MDITLHLDDLSNFSREEKFLTNEIFGKSEEKTNNSMTPSKHVVDRILNYSKALSVRKTKRYGTVEMILN